MYCNNHMLYLGDCPKTFKSISDERLPYLFSYTTSRLISALFTNTYVLVYPWRTITLIIINFKLLRRTSS